MGLARRIARIFGHRSWEDRSTKNLYLKEAIYRWKVQVLLPEANALKAKKDAYAAANYSREYRSLQEPVRKLRGKVKKYQAKHAIVMAVLRARKENPQEHPEVYADLD